APTSFCTSKLRGITFCGFILVELFSLQICNIGLGNVKEHITGRRETCAIRSGDINGYTQTGYVEGTCVERFFAGWATE
ncbi:hypothetical protein EDB19DRAFT_1684812, partial [Suillus lakei]